MRDAFFVAKAIQRGHANRLLKTFVFTFNGHFVERPYHNKIDLSAILRAIEADDIVSPAVAPQLQQDFILEDGAIVGTERHLVETAINDVT